MTVYRRFKVNVTDKAFCITEHEPTDVHPINWIDGCYTDRMVWEQARSTALPVFAQALDGSTERFDNVFNPDSFERAVYAGYVSYGMSMTDGYYAPMDFDAWVVSFRKDPEREFRGGNDAPQYVKAALPLYLDFLETVLGEQ